MIYLTVFLGLVIVLLLGKLILIKRSLKEITLQSKEILNGQTNSLICVSSADKDVRIFAEDINKTLRTIREKQITLDNENSKLSSSITAVSHDLRTPLTAMLGYIDLLEGEEKSEAACGYTKMIKNRANALRKLMEEFFGFSVLVSGEKMPQFENLSVNALIEESLAAFYAVMKEKGISPEVIMPQKNVERKLDKDFVMRIFSNIISNAAKYGSGDLKIELTENAKIIFSNSAPKLDSVTAAKLFDKFYTVENARGSTGLGLTVAKALAEQMGGDVYSDFDGETLSITVDFSDI